MNEYFILYGKCSIYTRKPGDPLPAVPGMNHLPIGNITPNVATSDRYSPAAVPKLRKTAGERLATAITERTAEPARVELQTSRIIKLTSIGGRTNSKMHLEAMGKIRG